MSIVINSSPSNESELEVMGIETHQTQKQLVWSDILIEATALLQRSFGFSNMFSQYIRFLFF